MQILIIFDANFINFNANFINLNANRYLECQVNEAPRVAVVAVFFSLLCWERRDRRRSLSTVHVNCLKLVVETVEHWHDIRAKAAKFIIFKTKFLVFDTQFLVFNAKSIGFTYYGNSRAQSSPNPSRRTSRTLKFRVPRSCRSNDSTEKKRHTSSSYE